MILFVTPFTADLFGQIKAKLKAKGKPIPENDIWIVASAIEHNLPLYATDSHFNDIEGLQLYKTNDSQGVISTLRSGTMEIEVRDNRPGIPQKVLHKIFQPFFTTKPTGQGTGLGLSLSYDIIKAHGGQLKMDTKEGEFAEFIISLPFS